jgi:hypothetical protein
MRTALVETRGCDAPMTNPIDRLLRSRSGRASSASTSSPREPKEKNMAELISRLLAAYAVPRTRNQRGDVPGWVLITVMTAGLVAALWLVAEPQLKSMLSDALDSVGG